MAPEISIDNIVHHITTSNNVQALNITIKNTLPKDARDLILAGPLGSGQDPLDVLDIQQNSLGVLYILSARLYTGNVVPPWTYINQFCETCEISQIRHAPERIAHLAKSIANIANKQSNPRLAIPSLLALVTRYPYSPSHLTSIHGLFLLTCAQARSFSHALPLLINHQIDDIASSLSPDLTYIDNLVYHYLGGVSLAAMNKWALAEDYFEICITAPASGQTISGIQLEALKKLKLVQLIHSGSTSPLPKYTNPSLLRAFRSTPYHNLVEAYPSNTEALRKLVEKERNTFNTEKTLGLVTQAIQRAPRWQVKKLTNTYVTLSFAEIGRQVGISSEESVRDLVLSMIESGNIHATLSTTTVTFSDPPLQFTKAQVDAVLYEAQQDFEALQSLDVEMSRSKDFLSKAVKSQSEWSSGVAADEDMFPQMGDTRGGAWPEDVLPL